MTNTQMPEPIPKERIVAKAQMMVDAGLIDGAVKLLDQHKVKYTIKNGKILDPADLTETILEQFITMDKNMLALKDDVRKLAKIQDEVLISGPTGTGKELIAKALHGSKTGKLQTCNAAGLPEHLVESELFGHIRGSFTGAMSDKIGLIVYAREGTFFLDEVGELPLPAQAKLLRVLQEKEVRPVGSEKDIDVSAVRFVFATNRDLRDMVSQGLFRADLFARISTFELHTKGLKYRMEDVIPILKSYNNLSDLEIGTIYHKIQDNPNLLEFNVRSLQSIVKRYKTLGKMPV